MNERELSNRIITLCNETEPKVQQKIQLIIAVCRAPKAALIFKDACILYQSGETLIDPDTEEERQRTLGGCFFKLARKRMNTGERKLLRELNKKLKEKHEMSQV